MTTPTTTHGAFYAKIKFPSSLKFREWEETVIDIYSDEAKEALAPISAIWMNDYPRTLLFNKKEKGPLTSPIKVGLLLTYFTKLYQDKKENFTITTDDTSLVLSVYLSCYDAIEDYTEILFLIFITAAQYQAKGTAFLVPDNYYFDFYDFIDLKLANSEYELEISDLQNIDNKLNKRIVAVETLMIADYKEWLSKASSELKKENLAYQGD